MFEVFCVVTLLLLVAGVGLTLSAVAGVATWSQMLQREVAFLQMGQTYADSRLAEESELICDGVKELGTKELVTRRYLAELIYRLFDFHGIPKDRPTPSHQRAFEAKVNVDWKKEPEHGSRNPE